MTDTSVRLYDIPASLSFCGKVVMLRGSPYGSRGRITPLCKPNKNIILLYYREHDALEEMQHKTLPFHGDCKVFVCFDIFFF